MALLFVAAAWVLTYFLRAISTSTPDSLFFCAIMLTGWRCGLGPAVIASILSSITIIYFVVPSAAAGDVGGEVVRFAVFLFAGVFISCLAAKLKQSEAELREAHDEEALSHYKEVLEKIFNNVPVMICYFSLEGHAVLVNHEWDRSLGWTLAEINDPKVDYLFRLFRDPSERQRARDFIKAASAKWEDFELTTKGGQVIDVSWASLRLSDGSTINIKTDITQRKQAEVALRESHQLLQLVLSTLPVGVLVTDRDGNVVLFNAASQRIWGADPIIFGRERWERSKGFWHDSGERIPPQEWASVRALTQGYTTLNELIDIGAFDGRQKIIRNSTAPIRDAQNSIVGAVIVNEDVTEVKRGEEKLRQLQDELARISRLITLGELTATIAHEVNQPLAAVVTNANAAKRWLYATPPNLSEAREAIDRIARDGTRASEVIQRIHALFKRQAPARASLDVNELIDETASLFQPEISRYRIRFQTDLAAGLPVTTADHVQLQQVLQNLLVNAVESLKTVPEGSRLLRVSTGLLQPGMINVAVHDTGSGIQDAERLFEPFYTTKTYGLGLGLSISRSIVESHGGQLSARANTPRGAIFEFTLPIQNGDTQ